MADAPVAMTLPVVKSEPMSPGDGKSVRKKKPKQIAFIVESCTGCSGAPACIQYCPIQSCMFWVPDTAHPPFGVIRVDPNLCIGCKKCTTQGPDDTFLEGCPWDAIEMVASEEYESRFGPVNP